MARPEKPAIFRLGKISLLLLGVILQGLACNFPIQHKPSFNLPGEALHQTLSAQEIPNLTITASGSAPADTATPLSPSPGGLFNYTTRSGDTLRALSARFAIPLEQYLVSQGVPVTGYLPIGTDLKVPNVLDSGIPLTPASLILPDSEAVNSPGSVDFNVHQFIFDAEGFLGKYEENVDGIPLSGAEIVDRVASESSVNPRLLLAFLEFQTDQSGLGTGWVFGQPAPGRKLDSPLGFAVPGHKGLYQELVMAATHFNIGYYGWREGTNLELRYSNGQTARIHPLVNPGSAGLKNLFAKLYEPAAWQDALYGQENFLTRYQQMFGDPWQRAEKVDPLLPEGLSQPTLELPFAPGERWSLSGGPHPAWNTGSPRGALDFSPVTGEPVCAISNAWATASAPGIVVRSANNVVALDLDGDGFEQTGWVLVYVHLASQDLIKVNEIVSLGQPLGHPSCERGQSTGKHVHVARKFNGEWLPAVEPQPFVLSGWQVVAGPHNYEGELVKGDQVVSANPSGARNSVIER